MIKVRTTMWSLPTDHAGGLLISLILTAASSGTGWVTLEKQEESSRFKSMSSLIVMKLWDGHFQ